MRTLELSDGSLSRALVLALVFGGVLALPGCNVNVKKSGEGREKNVDIETPIGALHVSKGADVRDVGLPVYPGARKKDSDNDSEEKSANVNISSSMFGLKVVAIQYLSDDAPEKIVAYYADQLKKYGSVLECHTNKSQSSGAMYSGEDSSESQQLKCEGDNNGQVIELKVGTKQNQRIVAIRPAESSKGSDFALVYIKMRGGKDTI